MTLNAKGGNWMDKVIVVTRKDN
uniref:Transcriptional regulator n=1 Tax=Heterorhabditis bacteriophora TaxID=37862 RepID=A0A1I7WKB4_HETBA